MLLQKHIGIINLISGVYWVVLSVTAKKKIKVHHCFSYCVADWLSIYIFLHLCLRGVRGQAGTGVN